MVLIVIKFYFSIRISPFPKILPFMNHLACLWLLCRALELYKTLKKKTMFCVYLFIFNTNLFNWRLITLRYCIGFAINWLNLPRVYICSPSWRPLPPPSPSHPSRSSHCTSPKHPVSCIEPGLVIVSYMIIYMFQCHSPKPSHPCLLP